MFRSFMLLAIGLCLIWLLVLLSSRAKLSKPALRSLSYYMILSFSYRRHEFLFIASSKRLAASSAYLRLLLCSASSLLSVFFSSVSASVFLRSYAIYKDLLSQVDLRDYRSYWVASKMTLSSDIYFLYFSTYFVSCWMLEEFCGALDG